MTKKITTYLAHLFLFLQITAATAYSNGTIKGSIMDGLTKDPLPFSNVLLIGTSWGSAADKEGNYTIANVPAGSYTIRCSYVGYKSAEVQIEVKNGATTVQDFSMEPESVEGETVVITAQAEGQLQAINEQLNSIAVKNVVSAAKIKELPDLNAAESVSRLPGVGIIRTGGEGSKVVIRGLSPQYNQITIDGVEMASNVASGNNLTSSDRNQWESTTGIGSNVSVLGDRAADLSMISSSMLGGIEVIKAITPDMDATLIGGVVNFGMRKASKNTGTRNLQSPWLPLIEIFTQGGYNNLKSTLANYKFVGSLEQRFLLGSFGVFLQGSYEKRNLSANEMGADYFLEDKTHGDVPFPLLTSLNLTDVFRERERRGLTAVLDYQYETGEIGFMNFFSSSKTNSTHRSEQILARQDDMFFSANDTRNELNVISNLLSIKQDIPLFHIDLKISHSYSESRNPEDLFFNFWQEGAGISNRDFTKVDPLLLASLAIPNPGVARLGTIQTSETFSNERTMAGSLDLQTEFPVLDWFTSKLKFGGSYQYRNRDYDFNSYSGSQLFSGGGEITTRMLQAFPQLETENGLISVVSFRDDYDYGEFLDGDYNLASPSINADLMRQIIPYIKGVSTTEGYRYNRLGSIVNDYSGDERKSAVYGMISFNIGDEITILPGVRYQNLTTEYTALRATEVPGGFQGIDTTISLSHGYYLPMVHLRYKPLDWLQVHFAYTNTLNYPDYSTITPRAYIGASYIQYNNFRLKPARSENFDLVVSLFSNEIGLLAFNGFRKNVKDLIFYSKTYKSDLSEYPDLPQNKSIVYEFFTYINNPIDIELWGIETDWQTNFWYLPDPFSSIVLSANYTHIFSDAGYPLSSKNAIYDEDGNLITQIVDTFYTTRMLNQPNDVVNLSLGYDFRDFSARVSMIYQDNIFKRPAFYPQERIISDKFTRFDLSIKQILPWFGIQVIFNLNNIGNERDSDINQKNRFPASQQHYGMTGDLGIILRL